LGSLSLVLQIEWLIVNFFQRVFAPRSPLEEGRKRSPWRAVPVLLFPLVLFGVRAVNRSGAASRQETSLGVVGLCEQRGRGNETYCHYSFAVGNEKYTGVSRAALGLMFGQAATVYYDREHPSINSLEDFSEEARRDKDIVLFLVLLLAGMVAFVLWDRTPYSKP
jgi:hypothetical protein